MDTLVLISTTDILTNNSCFCREAAFYDKKKANNDIEFRKEVKIIIVVDKWLHSLMNDNFS